MRADRTIYLSGRSHSIRHRQLVDGGIQPQAERVFRNMRAVVEAAGSSLDAVREADAVPDLAHFPVVNEIMQRHFAQPYPARSTVGVASLPRGALFEAEAIVVLD